MELRALESGFTRCQVVRFEARYQVPAVGLPFLGGGGPASPPPPATRRWSTPTATACPRPPPGATAGDGVNERGSVLLLFPAAVLIVIVLSAITVDSSIAFLAQRELANATAAAANDAASRGDRRPGLLPGRPDHARPDAVEAVAVERVRLAIDQSRHRAWTCGPSPARPWAPGARGRCGCRPRPGCRTCSPRPSRRARRGVGAGHVGRRARTRCGQWSVWSIMKHHGSASKVSKSAAGGERIRAEAELLTAAHHPGVVELVGLEGSTDRPVLVTVLVDGPTLAAPMPLTVEEVAGVVGAVAATLADLHELGIVHGAVVPEHVLLGPDGRPVLCGFGSAGRVGEDDELHPSTDVAALGRLLRRLATGPDARPLRRMAEAATADDPAARPSAGDLAAETGGRGPGRPASHPRSEAPAWARPGPDLRALVAGAAGRAAAPSTASGRGPAPQPAPRHRLGRGGRRRPRR